MRITVRLFAAAKDAVNSESVALELPSDATIRDLRAAMAKQHPALSDILTHSVFAIDNDYATDDLEIKEGSTIACIPPVSGG